MIIGQRTARKGNNMQKFIDAGALLLKFQEKDFLTMHDATYVARAIDHFPAAPVRREVHAAWVQMDVYEQDENVYECTACGFALQLMAGTPKENEYNGCPRCLATMDLGAKGAPQ